MNGPEHYRRSEELAKKASDRFDSGDAGAATASLIALAQVHATLAAAAAAADDAPGWKNLLHPRAEITLPEPGKPRPPSSSWRVRGVGEP